MLLFFLGNPCFPYNAAQLDEFRAEIQRRDQEILAMSAKMKTLEEQHQDYQRHIAVLKESLCAKEEHYNMLQADVSMECYRLFPCVLVSYNPGQEIL
jgi:septal ring factor EnvC (AmiA/AmiB activator)